MSNSAAWYVLRIVPSQEYAAVRELSRRGFGVYLPEESIRARGVSGKLTWRKRPLIPGYVFLWLVGALDVQWAAIRICTGVLRFLPTTLAPRRIEDAMIGAIQVLESELRGQIARARKRQRRRWRKTRAVPDWRSEAVAISSYAVGG